MLPRYNEINYKKSIKKRLVRLKLNGSLAILCSTCTKINFSQILKLF
jgi:hypothetical protein